MLLLETLSSISVTKISRNIKPYRHLLVALLICALIVGTFLHVSSLKDELEAQLDNQSDSETSIEDVDLDSSLYDDGNRKGVDIKMKRINIKQKQELWRKGGFAPIKKLKLTTEEPPVEIPPFFPEVDYNCKMDMKRVAGAWISHLKDPGDAQHRHRTDSWNLCFSDKLTRLQSYKPRGTGTHCVVYSFGMENNWSFEEDMLLQNCEVHMFDSSEGQDSNVIRRRVRNLSIHRAGLSDRDEGEPLSKERDSSNRSPVKKTLSTMMRELEHDRVDVLKIDIEGSELAALEAESDTLVNGVDQILLEVHMHISEHAHDSAKPEHFEQTTIDKWTKLFTSLRDDGYRVYDIRAKGTDRDGNIIPRHHYSCCYRIAMIKTPYRLKKPAENLDALDIGV